MKKTLLLTLLLVLTTMVTAQKYVGGDISLLPTYEEHGANYMDKDGKKITDMLAFLKEQGLNTMRVRLFVDPSKASDEAKGQGVRQDLDYVKALGKRIKDAGLNFMLDFHYSDTWADPSHQDTPDLFIRVNTPVWEYIYYYSKEALQTLVDAGATPDFIQTGNEISFGMLWDACKVTPNSGWNAYLDTNWDSFSTALKNASKACREVCPNAKIIIHTEQCANNPTLDVAFFNRIKNNDVDYDIIGVSYYPYFKGRISNLKNGLTQLETNFPDKQIMIVETGCGYHYTVGDKDKQYYPLTYEGQRQFTEELVTMLNGHQHVNGLFWWFLEANEYGLDWITKRVTDKWYDASLFDNETGRALPALYELKNFASSTGIGVLNRETITDSHWFTLDGRRLSAQPTQKGIYIHQGKKVIVK